MPSSTSPNCIGMTPNVIFVCCALYFMSQIYSMESPIGTVLSTNSMGLAHTRPIDTCTYCGQQTSCVASLSSEHTLWDQQTSIGSTICILHNDDMTMTLYSKCMLVQLTQIHHCLRLICMLLGANCTSEFFLWVVRWTSHSNAVSFNMVEQGTIDIRSTPWY